MIKKMEELNQPQKILLSAVECISLKGYANVSLRNIADEARVALSQLNYYYKNKEGLFTEVIKMMMQKYLQEVENHLRRGVTAKEKISALINYFHVTLERDPKIFRLLYDFTGLALWSPSFGKLLGNFFDDLAILIEKHVFNNIPVKGNLRGYSPKAIARMLYGAMFGTAIQLMLDPQEKEIPDALMAIEMMV